MFVVGYIIQALVRGYDEKTKQHMVEVSVHGELSHYACDLRAMEYSVTSLPEWRRDALTYSDVNTEAEPTMRDQQLTLVVDEKEEEEENKVEDQKLTPDMTEGNGKKKEKKKKKDIF